MTDQTPRERERAAETRPNPHRLGAARAPGGQAEQPPGAGPERRPPSTRAASPDDRAPRPSRPRAAHRAADGARSRRRQPPRRLYRSRDDRVIAGVCGGIARYFNIDPVLVRVGAVALAFLGGAGLLAYLAAVLLIPKEGEGGQPPEAPNRGMAITGVVLLVVAICVVLPFHGGWGPGWGLVPLGFIALAGLFVWRLASGQRPEGDATSGPARHGARRRADRGAASCSPSPPPGPRPRAATASWPGSSSRPASR